MNPIAPERQVCKSAGLAESRKNILDAERSRFQHVLIGGLARQTRAILPALGIKPGIRVLDVGCGFGDAALQLADRVGPTGSVLGVDRCQRFLNIARQRAEFSFCTNVKFLQQLAEPVFDEAAFDLVFARLGTQCFTQPVDDLRQLRKALRPGGRMAHIVWRQRADNPWLCAAQEVVQNILPPQGESYETDTSGQFLVSDEENLYTHMEAAGYTGIQFQRIDAKVLVGRSIADAIAFQLALGPAGDVVREAEQHTESRRAQIEAALAQLFQGVETDSQGLWMDSSAWLITASAPAVNVPSPERRKTAIS